MTPAVHVSASATTQPGAVGGLWIRLAVNIGRRKVTYRVLTAVIDATPGAEGVPLAIKRAAAVGLLAMLWSGIAEHTTDGVIAGLPDALLEDWAGWTGAGVESGAFARWIRTYHLGPDGKVRDWDDFAGALQTRRSADADRQREKRRRDRQARESAERDAAARTTAPPREVPPATTGADDATPYRHPPVAPGTIARNLTIAANKGMEANDKIGGRYNPIVSTRADALAVVEEMFGCGVTDWELMGRIIYTIAKAYTPIKTGDAIGSLTYFKARAIVAYHREQERAAAGASAAPGEVSLDASRPATANAKRQRTGAGALAAADAMGLTE